MDRRQILRRIGAGASLIAVPGVAAGKRGRGHGQVGPPEHAGPPDHAQANGLLEAKGGRLDINLDRDEWEEIQQETEERLPDGVEQISYDLLEETVSDLNRAISNDEISLSQDGDSFELKPGNNHSPPGRANPGQSNGKGEGEK